MSIKARLFDQFRRPRGAVGMLAGRIMSKRASNQDRSMWTVGLLDLAADDRVLELGYGPGLGIQAALQRVTSGRVVGIDHSTTMQRMASRRLRRRKTSTNYELRIADAEHLPAELGTFDKIFSCNVWLFWNHPDDVFVTLRDHLAPGGVLAVTHLPRHGDATRDTTLEAAATITSQLRKAGFTQIRHEILEVHPVPAVCVLTTKSAAERNT
jgi:cyclopropane fatty-acyl-phospholipid synthase-like methyltransferase